MTDDIFGEDLFRDVDQIWLAGPAESDHSFESLLPTDFSGVNPVSESCADYASVLSDNDGMPIFEDCQYDNVDDAFSKVFGLEIHGDPFGELANFDCQDGENSCAVATTGMIFKSLGYDFGEDVLSEAFESLGAYAPSTGTHLHMVADTVNTLAEHAGLPLSASEVHGFTVDQLKSMLNSGDRLLVGVDSYELYRESGLTMAELSNYPDCGHAVQLTGILGPDDECFAVINDPGLPNGEGMTIPMKRFMDAAADFNFTAVRVA